jgi:hypothetical protein
MEQLGKRELTELLAQLDRLNDRMLATRKM